MKKRHQISYVDLAINIKSHTEWMNYYSFIRIRSINFPGGKFDKEAFVSDALRYGLDPIFGGYEFLTPNRISCKFGCKTYKKDGKFYSFDPDEELPF